MPRAQATPDAAEVTRRITRAQIRASVVGREPGP
jgi:hypothetical protein